MKMNDSLKNGISIAMRGAFPGCHIGFSEDPEDENVVYVRVYDIPDEEVYCAKKRAWSVIETFHVNPVLAIVPSIVSRANTALSHPQFLRENMCDFDSPVPESIMRFAERLDSFAPFSPPEPHPIIAVWGGNGLKCVDAINRESYGHDTRIAA